MKVKTKTILKRILIILTVYTAIFIAALLLYKNMAIDEIPLNADERARITKEYGGSYINLSDGWTRYELKGKTNAPCVVLIHGGSMPMFSWDRQTNALLDAGFRLLRYDRYARGFSGRPKAKYGWDLYVRQLEELIDRLNIRSNLYLVGRSFGADIAAAYIKANPGKVSKLVLVSPAVLGLRERRLNIDSTYIPGLSEAFVRMVAIPLSRVTTPLLARRIKRQLGPEFEEEVERYLGMMKESIKYEGYERALISSMKEGIFTGNEGAYTAAASIDGALTIIWGDDDRVIRRKHIDLLLEKAPAAELEIIEGAGHSLNFTHADEFNRLLVRSLQ